MSEDKRVKCNICGEYPGIINASLAEDQVYLALECNCTKRTSWQRSESMVISEWESGTYKLTPEEAMKVEGPNPGTKEFKT